MRIRKLNHSVYQTQYHIVFGTKYRRKWLKDYVKAELIASFWKTGRSFPDWHFFEINTDQDHLHLIMEIPPSYSIAEVVQILKTNSSKALRKQFKFIDRIYVHSGLWSTGYFVSTIGLNEEQIKRYVQLQGEDDKGLDVTSEFS